MSKFEIPMQVSKQVEQLGQRIRIARIRRGWSAADLASKAGINRNTLTALELGKSGTAVGVYFTVLWALGLHVRASHAKPEKIMTSEREAYVYIQLPGTLEVVPAALLRVRALPDGTQIGRLRYGDRYLARPEAVAFDPFRLPLAKEVFELT